MSDDKYVYIDAHSHLHEYTNKEIEAFLERKQLYIVSVGDDYESSLRNIELSRVFGKRVKPCVGLHPWEIGRVEEPLREATRILELINKYEIDCLGEVGLDTKFVPETIGKQREIFNLFLKEAKELNIVLNLHTAGTWDEVYRLLIKNDIELANFHWYTGPVELLEDIKRAGYTISINPAIKIQKKHRRIAELADVDIILVESDSPYEYRSLKLNPLMVEEVIKTVSSLKKISLEEMLERIQYTARRVFRWP